jgi:hypothetical protein
VSRRWLYLSLGVVAGVLAVRAAAQAGGQQGAGGSLGERIADFLADVRLHMAEREEELREALGLDGTHDMVDAHL